MFITEAWVLPFIVSSSTLSHIIISNICMSWMAIICTILLHVLGLYVSMNAALSVFHHSHGGNFWFWSMYYPLHLGKYWFAWHMSHHEHTLSLMATRCEQMVATWWDSMNLWCCQPYTINIHAPLLPSKSKSDMHVMLPSNWHLVPWVQSAWHTICSSSGNPRPFAKHGLGSGLTRPLVLGTCLELFVTFIYHSPPFLGRFIGSCNTTCWAIA